MGCDFADADEQAGEVPREWEGRNARESVRGTDPYKLLALEMVDDSALCESW